MIRNVSVVIPAYNASTTLHQSIDSLLAQTYPHWEAIIVDDGSQDNTFEVAQRLAAQDDRLRVIQQPNQGVSIARNTGIAAATYDWILFLDADDTIAPEHLAMMTDRLKTDPELGAVMCGWQKVTMDGELLYTVTYQAQAVEDLFAELTRYCVFAVHACITRKQAIQAVGCFDPSLRSCEDWDLWQRLARSGIRFGVVEAVLAYYQVQPHSLSAKARQLFIHALQVIDQGHRPDPRVATPHPAYAQGQPPSQLPKARLQCLIWMAGLTLGSNGDPDSLFSLLPHDPVPDLDPYKVAYSLFYTATVPTSQPLTAWTQLWPTLAPNMLGFLHTLEAQSGARGIAKRSQVILEQMVRDHWQGELPTKIGTTYVMALEVFAPLPDVQVDRDMERLYLHLMAEGRDMGRLELPICDGWVSQEVLADGIATQYAWDILRYFLARRAATSQPPAHHLSANPEQTAWLAFLQDLWGLPGETIDRFYDARGLSLEDFHTVVRIPATAQNPMLRVEVSQRLPAVVTASSSLDIMPTVGGVPLGVITIPTQGGIITPRRIRAAITQASNFELCQVCVREGLVGQSLHSAESLRQRLAQRAATHGSGAMTRPRAQQPLLLARRSSQFSTSTSRRAMLPRGAVPDLVAMTQATHEPIVLASQMTADYNTDYDADYVAYVPDLICHEGKPIQQWYDQPKPPGIGRQGYLFLRVYGGHLSESVHLTAKRFTHRLIHRRGTGQRTNQPTKPSSSHRVSTILGPGRHEDTTIVTDHLPILMYHRIAPNGVPVMKQWRVTPDAFAAQLRYLRDAGYYSITLETWRAAVAKRQPLPGRAVLLTFDDGYLDFFTHAFPLLQEYGFSAIVFLVADYVGRTNSWDEVYGEELPLMNWEQIRYLQSKGIAFGSHTATHPPLTSLSVTEIAQEAARSRAILSQELGQPVHSFAYPHGDRDAIVEQLVGACGYLHAVTCRPGLSQLDDSLLSLPRLLVDGNHTLNDFITRLNPSPENNPSLEHVS